MSNVYKQKEAVKEYERKKKMLDEELHKYQTAYDILMSYWDYFPENMRPEIDKKLMELEL